MPLEPELLALLTQTVTLEPWTGQSVTGKPAYAPPRDYPARIELKSMLVRLKDGREAVARGRAFLALDVTQDLPTITDRVTLPAGYVPNQPPILDVQAEPDETSLHHVILVLG